MQRMWFLLLLMMPILANAQLAPSQQRDAFKAAISAVEKGKTHRYQELKKQLQDYPLLPYLEFELRSKQLVGLNGRQGIEVLSNFSGGPLYDTYKHRFLKAMGQRKRWQDFLTVSKEPPHSTELKCYYYRAKRSQGQFELAWQGAEEVWLTSRSLPKACDPLIREWRKAGKRGNELIWERMLLTYRDRQGSRLSYLNTLLSKSWRDRGDLLVRLYRHPKEIRQRSTIKRHKDYGVQMAELALKRIARKDPAYALKQFPSWEHALGEQRLATLRYLIKYALADNLWNERIEAYMVEAANDELIVLRTRQLIADADWKAINFWLAKIEDTGASSWRYWRARAMDELGLTEEAQAELQSLAQERSFYGFSAAQQLGLPYQLNQELPTIEPQLSQQVATLESVQRIDELLALEWYEEAKREWRWQLLRQDKPTQQAMTQLAFQRGWHFLSVQGTITAKDWNAVPWRFPDAYGDDFAQFAEMRSVDDTLLRAIARRESALYPLARSGANAYGLMQILPSTAKQVARQIGAKYPGAKGLYQTNYNIRLGSAYIKQLLERYDNNRILAAAAYNAGPHRVKRWLKQSDGRLEMDQFVETIPFRETRDYVKAILSYQLIYQKLDDRDAVLATDTERNRRY
ncbi:transglycosylase SLT domain-containing protein [Ferrimonas aestuarii]|uniref:Lytic transglycosylase n=1 Tax=Ferrimonas aestuarii TaxID=2569539 RepID=A0A4U1BSU9_9GAMM|nr:transglycosylase SLT domain-containing protein [Ferrimonas aestuarii]TKB58506.1 lytic transglycosylase [Ferrimonas aestuarii]